MSKRQSTARELEESLLRNRALLVARKARKPGHPVSTRETSPGDVKPATLNSKQSIDGVSINATQPSTRSLEEARAKLNELSRNLERTISAKRRKMGVGEKLRRVSMGIVFRMER